MVKYLLLILLLIPLASAIPTITQSGQCQDTEGILLHQGWNAFTMFPLNDTDVVYGDLNYSLVNGDNFLGASFLGCKPLSSFIIWNGANSLSYNDAVNNNWIEEIQKLNSSVDINDKTKWYQNKICQHEAFWIKSNLDNLKLSILNVNHSPIDETFAWNKLRFMNSSGYEANITDAGSIGQALNWAITTLLYQDIEEGGYAYIDGSGGIGTKNNISSFEGVWLYSNQNSLSLIRQNSTHSCSAKIKIYGTNNNKIKLYGTTNSMISFYTTHFSRLLGGMRDYLDNN